MKTIEEVLDNYSYYEQDDFCDYRFSKRFIDYLTDEQIIENIEKVKYNFKPGVEREVKEWTEKNIIEQLEKDVRFGWEKCCNERGISAELMSYVVIGWNRVLENGMEELDYGWYGNNVFKTTAEHYGWQLEE